MWNALEFNAFFGVFVFVGSKSFFSFSFFAFRFIFIDFLWNFIFHAKLEMHKRKLFRVSRSGFYAKFSSLPLSLSLFMISTRDSFRRVQFNLIHSRNSKLTQLGHFPGAQFKFRFSIQSMKFQCCKLQANTEAGRDKHRRVDFGQYHNSMTIFVVLFPSPMGSSTNGMNLHTQTRSAIAYMKCITYCFVVASFSLSLTLDAMHSPSLRPVVILLFLGAGAFCAFKLCSQKKEAFVIASHGPVLINFFRVCTA